MSHLLLTCRRVPAPQAEHARAQENRLTPIWTAINTPNANHKPAVKCLERLGDLYEPFDLGQNFLLDLANPALLAGFASLEKTDSSGRVPVAAREAIGCFCQRLWTSTILGILSSLKDDTCGYVVSCLFPERGGSRYQYIGIGGLSREDALQEWSQREDLSPQLRVHLVQRMDPVKQSGALVDLVVRADDAISTAAKETLLRAPEAVLVHVERLFAALSRPAVLDLLLAALKGEVRAQLEGALTPCMGTIESQMLGGDAEAQRASRTLVTNLSPGMRARCIPTLVKMLPDPLALKLLLADLKPITAETKAEKSAVSVHAAEEARTEEMEKCMQRLVEMTEDEEKQEAAMCVLNAVQAVSPELLAPYAKDIFESDVLYELAPKLPERTLDEYAIKFARDAIAGENKRIRHIATRALRLTEKVVRLLVKKLANEDAAVRARAMHILRQVKKATMLVPHTEQILSAPDDPAFELVGKLPANVLADHQKRLLDYSITHEDERVRGLATAAFQKVEKPSMEALVTYLESDDDAAQARAVSLLKPLLEREGSAVLGAHAATLLSAPERPAFALVAMLDTEAVNANVGTLLQLLAHDTEAVRSTAARACQRIRKIHGVAAKEHFETLRVLLTNESETVRSAAEMACRTIDVAARKALAKTLVGMLSQSAAERSMAEKLLYKPRHGDMELDVATDLLRLLQHPDDAIRHSAAKLANKLRPESLSGTDMSLLESVSHARKAVAESESVAEGEAMDMAADGEVVQGGEAAGPAANVAAPTKATALTLDEVHAHAIPVYNMLE